MTPHTVTFVSEKNKMSLSTFDIELRFCVSICIHVYFHEVMFSPRLSIYLSIILLKENAFTFFYKKLQYYVTAFNTI